MAKYRYLKRNNFKDEYGLIVPFYIYPQNQQTQDFVGDFYEVIDFSKYPIDLITILNPASGPGETVDGVYTEAIKRLSYANANPIGYVYIQQGERDLTQIYNEIDKQHLMYPDIQGIFLDEFPNTNDKIIQVARILNYIDEKGLEVVVVNPGTTIEEDLYRFIKDRVDVIITYENNTLNYFNPSNYRYYNRNKSGIFLKNQQSLPASNTLSNLKKYFKQMYICDTEYSTVPQYLYNYLSALP